MNVIDEDINKLPEEFEENQDVGAFMNTASEFILRYLQRRLNNDPDTIGDFYLEFYQSVPACLEKYKSYPHIPFIGFLASYLSFEFMNYIRKKRREDFDAMPASMILPNLSRPQLDSDYIHSAPDDQRHRLSRELEKIPMKQRLPVKLYFGLELGLDELQELVLHHKTNHSAVQFLHSYRQKRSKRLQKLAKMQDRVRYLNHMIHSSEKHIYQNKIVKPAKYSHWKSQILIKIDQQRGIYSFEELAQLLKVSRSTIMRRINKAQKQLKGELEWNQQAQSAS